MNNLNFWDNISEFRSMELVFERYGSDIEDWIKLLSLDQWTSFFEEEKAEHIIFWKKGF